MRRVKAEGGWAVVCTEQVEIHPPRTSRRSSRCASGTTRTSRRWPASPRDARARRACRHRARLQRHERREPVQPRGPARARRTCRSRLTRPVQARRMTQGRHRRPAPLAPRRGARSLRAGYDLVYVYAAHGSALQHFLSPRYNDRTDEYGGSSRTACGCCARSSRTRWRRSTAARRWRAASASTSCSASDGIDRPRSRRSSAARRAARPLGLHGRQLGGRLGHLAVRRGRRAGAVRRGLKELTTKPVVGVGRFTSPDTMVRQVRDGVLDLIGAARPSIADPFLPRKMGTAGWRTSASASAATSASPAT